LLQILKDHQVEFTFYDIIEDELMRYWLRDYKNWPTYPQVYVNGNFIGGLDVVKDLVVKGEFSKMIPDSAKTQDPQQKYKLLTGENEVIAFTDNFSFENKETETFLNAQKEKHQNLPVVNVSLDARLSEYIKSTLNQQLPFVVVKGEIQKV
jgi:glutaredoxin